MEPAQQHGLVITESGFTLQHQPNTVRGPDVSFVSRERMRGHEMGRGFPSIAPDLVVEIRSPDDFWTELQDKAREYLAAGSRLVWLVEMDQFVEVWSPGEPARRLAVGDELRAEVVLPGFSCRVADFFPPTA